MDLLVQRHWFPNYAADLGTEHWLVTPQITKDLFDIQIPRWIHAGLTEAEDWTLHTFCDASKTAYADLVFLCGGKQDKVFITLLASKNRIAPVKKITIPRLELLAAVIGARLYTSVQQGLQSSYKSIHRFKLDPTT